MTAIKQATRFKHLPLNKYESLYSTVYDEDSEKQLMDVISMSSALQSRQMRRAIP